MGGPRAKVMLKEIVLPPDLLRVMDLPRLMDLPQVMDSVAQSVGRWVSLQASPLPTGMQ